MNDERGNDTGNDYGNRLPPLSDYWKKPRSTFEDRWKEASSRMDEPEHRRITFGLLGAATGVFLFLFYWLYICVTLPSLTELEDARFQEASVVLTADGKELTRYYDQNRIWVPLDSISENVQKALVATEDHRFYQHFGVDVRRTLGSILHTLGGDTQGGSTLTMQFARNAFPEIGDDFVLTRKIKEWITAVQIELIFTKEEILEMYLNTVPMLYNTYGFETASRTYFGKHAKDLGVGEAATLVGMLKGTVLYNPVKNPEASLERRNVVLEQMNRRGVLADDDLDALKRIPTEVHFNPVSHVNNMAPNFAEHLRQELNKWADDNGYNLYTDGLRIHTTIDSRLQLAAEGSVQRIGERLQTIGDVEWSTRRPPVISSNFDAYWNRREGIHPFAYFWESNPEVLETYIKSSDAYKALEDSLGATEAYQRLSSNDVFVDSLKQSQQLLQAAFMAIDPHTAAVRAWVGGRDYETDKFDHVFDARRQPGSTFKPFVYVTALANGYGPEDVLRDEERAYKDRWTGKIWKPTNVDGASGDLFTLRDALARSVNTITAQLITDIGPQKVARTAHELGIRSELEAVPSLGLGTSVVSLFELTSAYATLVANGVRHEPWYLVKITDRQGKELESFEPSEGKEVIDPSLAYTVVDMMRGVVDYGTGIRIRSVFGARGDFAAKTGTSQEGADGWFMLMHPDLVMGAWVGFKSPSITFRSNYWEQGAHTALYVVGEVLESVSLPATRFTAPSGYRPPRSTGRTYLAGLNADSLSESRNEVSSPGQEEEYLNEGEDGEAITLPVDTGTPDPDDPEGDAPTSEEGGSGSDALNREERRTNDPRAVFGPSDD